MDSVDCEHDAVKHADPHDDVGRPSVTYHFIDETLNAQVVGLVLGGIEHLAAGSSAMADIVPAGRARRYGPQAKDGHPGCYIRRILDHAICEFCAYDE
jgi:hypothetical protein